MMDKRKIPFWRLSLIFGAITVLGLAVSYGDALHKPASSMMTGTMAQMMGMHLENITIRDLIAAQEQEESSISPNSTGNSSHHGDENSFLKITHRATTGVVVGLLPPIIAGTVFLTIIWIKV